MIYNFAICDDSTDDLDKLSGDLSTSSFQLEHDFQISKFTTGDDLIASLNKKAMYDAIFLDIELSNENGIEIARKIKERYNRDILIIFVSSYPQYMHDSFSVHPFYFLQKPYDVSDLKNVLNDVISTLANTHQMFSLIDTDLTQYSVRLKDIYYIEIFDSKKNRILFHLEDKTINAKGTISYWNDALENHAFSLCNRTTLINMYHLHFIDGDSAYLTNGAKIEISKRCKKKLINRFLNNIVSTQ